VGPTLLFGELKRRRVFRALVGYGIAAFAVLQIVEPITHGLHWPDAVLSYVVVALAAGFPVVVAMAWIFDVKAGRIERAPAARLRGLPLAAVLIAIGAAAAAPGLFYFFVVRSARTVRAPASIAVLPFVNMSSDKESDYFSDGITEELINALANVKELRVASRTAVFALRGKNLGIRELGEDLKVGTLLEGSVRREGNALRITAQLINVSDGYHLWSNTYDRELKSIFAVEDEIARSIAAALQRTLVGIKPPTTDLRAHDLYLKGRYFWNKRTSEALRKSAVFFEDAIRHDPGYALAYCGLADALSLRIDYDNARPSEVLPKAKEAALRALELEPGLAEAHAALGNVANFQNDWTAALAENRKALELNPNYAMAQKWIGNVLMLTGHLQEGRDAFERTLQLDPTLLIAISNVGQTYFYERDYPKAIEQYSKTLEMDPEFELARFLLARAYSWQGEHTEALAETDRLHLAPLTSRQLLRANVLARAGRREEALALARGLEARSAREHMNPVVFAALWLALGDHDKALTILGKACADHEDMSDIKVAPEMDPLRADPRYHDVLRCANLE
jgi:TolB-like protein/Flp pilus assembly protein TadD